MLRYIKSYTFSFTFPLVENKVLNVTLLEQSSILIHAAQQSLKKYILLHGWLFNIKVYQQR